MLSRVSNAVKYIGLRLFFNGLQKTLEEEVSSVKGKLKKSFKEGESRVKKTFKDKKDKLKSLGSNEENEE